MPDELSPGYSACSSCSRVIATRHANSSGRCATCAGKTEDQIEELQDGVAHKLGFNVLRHRHELFGLCEKAQGVPGGRCPREALGQRGRS